MWESIGTGVTATAGLLGASTNLYSALNTGKYMDQSMQLQQQQAGNQQTLFDQQMRHQADAESFNWGLTPQEGVVA